LAVTSLAWTGGSWRQAPAAAPPGPGLFETIGARGGDCPLWRRHLARLASSAAALGLTCEAPPDLRERARSLLRGDAADGVLRLALHPGPAGGSWRLATRPRGTAAEPLRLALAPAPRAIRALDVHKHTDRADLDELRRWAEVNGADEALLHAPSGRVLEGTYHNLFFLVDGEWCTPALGPGGVLAGIARRALLDAMAALGAPVREDDFRLAELRASPAIVLTNAVSGPRCAALAGAPASGANPFRPVWAALVAAGS
jgi:branched-subunit amino acid aminotransferase/4-amino-4-deoxychorismate lyase